MKSYTLFNGFIPHLFYLLSLYAASALLFSSCNTGAQSRSEVTDTAIKDSLERLTSEDKIEHNDTLVPTVTKGTWIAGSFLNKNDVEELGLENFFGIKEITDTIFARINGNSYQEGCPVKKENLRLLRLIHVDANNKIKRGELICNELIADDVLEIFKTLYISSYPVESVRLIDEFNSDDIRSMNANNTSCFNFRPTSGGSKLSRHAYGMAIDLNPRYNPYTNRKTGKVLPPESEEFSNREHNFTYKIDKQDVAYKEFTRRGFRWGGNWKTIKDYQHFEK